MKEVIIYLPEQSCSFVTSDDNITEEYVLERLYDYLELDYSIEIK